VEQARAAVDAGIDLFQIRERDLPALELARLVESVLTIARGSSMKVLVNDRVDVGLACAADGVHLRGDSVPAAEVRRIAPPSFVIGRSIHTVDEARETVGADYLIAGTAFPSSSKPDATAWLGVDGLRAIVRATSIPVLAIGGLTLDRVGDVAG